MTALRYRLALWVACGLFAVPASHAQPAASLSVDIAAQPLAMALAEFHRQTGLQLVYASNLVEGRSSAGAQAGLGPSAALAEMLAGTNLRFEFLNERTIGIFPAGDAAQSTTTHAGSQQRRPSRGGELGVALEEVIVTATRREEQVNRVPISMTVWTQDTMEASGIKNMDQLGALTPGINFSLRAGLGGDFYTELSIRGVSNRHGAVASVYLDDVPLPPMRAATYMRSFPYVFDLDRVEVLRGPQSTLLGDRTQAGALRFFMNQPSLTDYSALARAEWTTTAGGAPGYEIGAAAGGPIVDEKLGFRASAWYQLQGGYVDRVDPATLVTVEPSSNSVVSKMTHAAVTFAPSEFMTITPSITDQSTTVRDTSTFYTALSNPSAGDFRSGYVSGQPFTDNYVLTALNVAATHGPVALASITSYFDRTARVTIDLLSPPLPGGPPYTTPAWYPGISQRVFFQDLRLSPNGPNGAVAWLAGAFYSSGHTDHTQSANENGILTPWDTLHVDQSELDAFGQVEFRLSSCLTAIAGTRFGHTRFEYHSEFAPVSSGSLSHDWTAPRFVLSCQLNEQLFYATVAKGVGSGGVYPAPFASTVEVVRQRPEALWSYEIGAKNDFAAGRVHVDTSLFHIDWDNGQPYQGNPSSPELIDVPGAVASYGVDLAIQARVGVHLSLALAAEYVDARFTRTVTQDGVVIAREGDSLGVSPFSATASIAAQYPLRAGATANLRIEDVYHGSPAGQPFSANQGSPYANDAYTPATNVINLRAAMQWLHFDAALFVSNVLNSHPVLQNQRPITDDAYNQAETIIPRTFSLTGTWHY